MQNEQKSNIYVYYFKSDLVLESLGNSRIYHLCSKNISALLQKDFSNWPSDII